jgi:hypothetical protein
LHLLAPKEEGLESCQLKLSKCTPQDQGHHIHFRRILAVTRPSVSRTSDPEIVFEDDIDCAAVNSTFTGVINEVVDMFANGFQPPFPYGPGLEEWRRFFKLRTMGRISREGFPLSP